MLHKVPNFEPLKVYFYLKVLRIAPTSFDFVSFACLKQLTIPLFFFSECQGTKGKTTKQEYPQIKLSNPYDPQTIKAYITVQLNDARPPNTRVAHSVSHGR